MRYNYNSNLAPHIIGLIRQKHSNGFIYNDAQWHLKKLDEFLLEHFPKESTITHEVASKWSVIRLTEGKQFRRHRVVILRQLCFYILSLGLEAYVPRSVSATEKSVLYIPSQQEISDFFKELDSWEDDTAKRPNYIRKYKTMFRLYYCCGLRLSEVRLLKREHLNLEEGTLTILQSKGRKDRLVYLPQDGIAMLSAHLEYVDMKMPTSEWLFPGQAANGTVSPTGISRTFTKCWMQLPHAAKTTKRPSVHCLRHAFVVERLNDWMARGIDLQEMLPYLSSHLGHASPSGTFYYYHLVSKAFDVVRQKDKVSMRVIPEVLAYEEA